MLNLHIEEMQIKTYIRLLRPHQWLKNSFVFLPMFFDKHLLEIEFVIPTVMVFMSFSLAASGIYCFNDIWDVDTDRKHPQKCNRPIACGVISKTAAYILMLICFFISFTIIFFSSLESDNEPLVLYGIITFYILMNIAYCVKLKQIAIVDVFIIALGFVLRILAGGYSTGIYLSHWIVLMTFMLALFLAFAKRRDDVVMYEESGVKMRKNVNRYNLAFMNQAIAIVATITMVCYIMYTVSPDVIERFRSTHIYVTSIFVLAGIIRYMQLTIVDVKSGSPTKVLMKDMFIQVCVLGWIGMFALLLYL